MSEQDKIKPAAGPKQALVGTRYTRPNKKRWRGPRKMGPRK